jgi:hypothetical protein
MAINFSSQLLGYSNNQTNNTAGRPKMLLHKRTAIEPVPEEGVQFIFGSRTPMGRVITLGQYEGCFYGDLMVSQNPTTPSAFANVLVSDKVDYEISFWFWQRHDNPSVELSIAGTDKYGNTVKMFDIVDATEKYFFLRYPEKGGNSGRWQFARFILYRSDIHAIETNYLGQQPLTSLAVGTNLVMDAGTKFVNIKLVNNSTEVKLYEFLMKPLRTPFSTGFLGGGDLIELWRKVNTKQRTEQDIDILTKQRLLPYNVGQAVINI